METHINAVILFVATLLAVANIHFIAVNGADPQVPCFFIFGDSLADSGNNNALLTVTKSNYRPYGVDFPGSVPTGRFGNGFTTVDFIGKLLGFSDLIPPFLTARVNRNTTLKGLNYASGGSGIRDETGQHMGVLLSMDRQLRGHETTVSRVNNILGGKSAGKEYLKKCIYHVGMGNNDYLNNYFLPRIYPTSRRFTPQQYAQALIDQYRGQITKLYEMGARKVALAGTGLIGCTPYAISTFGRNASGCADALNTAAQLFNNKLVELVDELNARDSDAQYIFINLVGIGSGDPTSVGFSVLDQPCCEDIVQSTGLCRRSSAVCPDRDMYVFWDNYHPTERVNNFTAIRSYTSFLPSDTYPIDIKRLAELQL